MTSMRAALNDSDVALLARWLPSKSLHGGLTLNARTLVSELFFDTPSPELLRAHRDELDQALVDFRKGTNWKKYTPPIGRGGTSVGLNGMSFAHPSTWEHFDAQRDCELSLESESSAHAGLDALVTLRSGNHLDVLLPALLCEPSLADARKLLSYARTHRALSEDPWVRWLADEDAVPADLSDAGDLCRAIEHALGQRFHRAFDALPVALQKPRTAAVKPLAEETMFDQVTAQLVTNATDAKPTATVIHRSMATLFSHWGYKASMPSYSGTNVRLRMPVVALYRARFAASQRALDVLYALREHIEHVREPIAKQFVAPRPVIDALDALAKVVRFALENHAELKRSDASSGYLFSAG